MEIYDSNNTLNLDFKHSDEATLPPHGRYVNSPLRPVRLRALPDKMATSNGGGMEVDGAGEYLSYNSEFLPAIVINT